MPGFTVLTRIFLGASSSAKDFTKPTKADLEAPYNPLPMAPLNTPAIEEV